MAVEAQAQQLQADAPGGGHGGAVAHRFAIGITGPPIGEVHPFGVQAEGLHQLPGHGGGEGGGVLGPQPHILIEVEAAPAGAHLRGQGGLQPPQPPGQGGIYGLHGAPGGQAQGQGRP